MKRIFIALFLLATMLNAQTEDYSLVSSSLVSRVPPIYSYSNLQNRLKQERAGAVVVVSQNRNDALATLSYILSDDRLLPFGLLDAVATHADNNVGKPIVDLQSWADLATRWVFVDSRGEITASGENFPTVEELLREIDSANIRPRTDILRQLVRQNPDFLEAQIQLMLELRRVGDIRSYSALKLDLQQSWPSSSMSLGTGLILNLHTRLPDDIEDGSHSLSESEDEVIWEEFARVFNNQMPKLLPLSGTLRLSLSTFVPHSLTFSTVLKNAASRFSPLVEEAIQRDPLNSSLWQLWLALKPDGSISDLLDSIVLPPFTSESSLPPSSVRSSYIAQCRKNKDWEKIIELTEPTWNRLIDLERTRPQLQTLFVAGVWAEVIEPLLESLLATRKFYDAEHIISTWQDNSGWPPAFQRAANIARLHGYEDLAEKWENAGNGR